MLTTVARCSNPVEGGRSLLLLASQTPLPTLKREDPKFSTAVRDKFGSTLVVHQEDNEREILENQLKTTYAELEACP